MKKGKSPGLNPAVGLPYGLKNNELVTIDEVTSGLDCDCSCPACYKKLVARKGPLVKSSFGHYAVADCNRGIEAALQQLCSDIIAAEKRFTLPPLYFSYGWQSKITAEKEIVVTSAKLQSKQGSLVPDIVLECRGKLLLVEITVNERVSRDRMQLLKSENITGLEVHVPRMIEYLFQRKDFRLLGEEFRKELLYQVTSKFWIHHPRLSKIEAILKEEHAVVKTINWFKIESGIYQYVNDCPLQKKAWTSGPREGQSYASVEDCNRCYFCLSKYDKSSGTVYCIGHLKDTLGQVLWKIKA